MNTSIKNFFLLLVVFLGLSLIPPGRAQAQTLKTLHYFSTYGDGMHPGAALILSGNVLYGTAPEGGRGGGVVFGLNTDGTGFRNLYSFTALSNSGSTNSDGAYPSSCLVLSGDGLYGTAPSGGSSDWGTLFKVNTNGTDFTNLHNFLRNVDGNSPRDGLVLVDNKLYGTTTFGASGYEGTVFAVNTDGTGFTNLYSFSQYSFDFGLNVYVNSDGAAPNGLILSGNTLYGTTGLGGSLGNGTVFAVNIDGTAFTLLHIFTSLPAPYAGTNSDGGSPRGALVLSGNTLYGTASGGGSSGNGTVFAVNTDGTGFTVLHSFTVTFPTKLGTNSDGAAPLAGLILSGQTLYGTTFGGGGAGNGTVFAVNTNGTGFTTLYSFSAGTGSFPNIVNSDGAYPNGLILSGNTLYGTAVGGGRSGVGTVFSLSLGEINPPQLSIVASGLSVILKWPTNTTGFTLQSITSLTSPAVWTTVSAVPVVVNGQNAVTNPMSGTQQFYRLGL